MSAQSSSPFTNPAAVPTMTGFGAASQAAYDQTALTATGTITLSIANNPTQWAIAITKGKLRIKSSAVNGATTIAIGVITVTDGTNTVTIKAGIAASAAGTNVDYLFEWASDIQVNSLSFTVTLAGGTTIATISTELAGNP